MSWSQAAQLHIFAPAESTELQPSHFSSSPSAGTVLNLIFRRQVWQTDVASWPAGEPAPSSSAIASAAGLPSAVSPAREQRTRGGNADGQMAKEAL